MKQQVLIIKSKEKVTTSEEPQNLTEIEIRPQIRSSFLLVVTLTVIFILSSMVTISCCCVRKKKPHGGKVDLNSEKE